MRFTSDLFEGFATLLAGAGIGLTYRGSTPYTDNELGIYDEQTPPDRDRTVTLTFYPLTDDPTLSDSQVGMQVKTRGRPDDPTDARDRQDDAFSVLQNLTVDLPTGIRIASCFRTSGASLGQDDNKRWIRTANYTLQAHQPSLHRV